jgi:predicted amidohydrolase YtcJ
MKLSLRSVLALVMSAVTGGFVRGAEPPPTPPDAVYIGGKVITVDNAFAVREAFAVKEGRIVAVGDTATIRALARAGVTTIHDLRGRAVLPGLIDSHVHATSASMTEFEHPIPDMETIADVLAYFRERAKVVPEGEWISLSQVFITRLRESRFPTRAELDAAAPKHPVAFHTGPDVMLSSLALKLNGIDRNFEVKDGREGYLEKDATGEPTGVLRGLGRFVKKSESTRAVKVTDADRLRRLGELFRDYNRVGLTTVADRGANAQSILLYEGMLGRGELTLRLALSHTIPTSGSHESIMRAIDGIGAHRLRAPSPWLRIIGTKMWLDGGMLTGSAYMLKPWGKSEIYGIRDEKYLGVLNVSPEQLQSLVRQVAKNGMQFTAHVQGDGAVTTLMDTYERVNAEIPLKPLRMGLTHSSFMTAEVLERVARLGVVPDIQPIWLYLDARTLVSHFGYDRLRYFQPLRSLAAAGGIAGGGSDHMQKIGDKRAINSYNPFLGMWITLTRNARWLDQPLHPEEALTRADAIRFYTRNNAHLLFWEKEIGSLEPGKRADFIVVDRDLLSCPIDDIKDTRVLQTWIEGRLVHGHATD